MSSSVVETVKNVVTPGSAVDATFFGLLTYYFVPASLITIGASMVGSAAGSATAAATPHMILFLIIGSIIFGSRDRAKRIASYYFSFAEATVEFTHDEAKAMAASLKNVPEFKDANLEPSRPTA